MKLLLIIVIVAAGALLIFQGWTYYISKVEEQPYKVLKVLNLIEIRHYPAAKMATVNMAKNNNQNSSNGFRTLAGYIFGGNDKNQEFAMTAPVHISKSDSLNTMSFVLPEGYWNSELPTPNNKEVKLHWSKEQTVAAIRFGGFRSDEKEAKMKAILLEELQKNNIKHLGDFSFLSYDPPFKMIDRRNDLIVSIDAASVK